MSLYRTVHSIIGLLSPSNESALVGIGTAGPAPTVSANYRRHVPQRNINSWMSYNTTYMGEHLSDTDWELIRRFAETPAYERSPEILVGAEGDESPDDGK